MDKKISVIVPVFNSSGTLEKCLEAIRGAYCEYYELIVIDDASCDGSHKIAERFADLVIRHEKRQGEGSARNSGVNASHGDILIFIDSDVVIEKDSLGCIAGYFNQHESVSALTGRLSAKHVNKDFFSQYKNLYMHYIFGLLPERVDFLYGSIHAVRRKDFSWYRADFRPAADTELGMALAKKGKEIAFLKNLEVTHLKRYGFFSFIKNDFRISSAWAGIFIKRQGFERFFKNSSTGFAHSPKWQIISVAMAPLILLFSFLGARNINYFSVTAALGIVYFFLNSGFMFFLLKSKGAFFAFNALFATFFDNIIMASGILHGFISGICSGGGIAKE